MGTTAGNANLRIGVLEKSKTTLPTIAPPANSTTATPGVEAPKHWHSRGYLPHFDSPTAIQHVTLHLADSLPNEALAKIEADLKTMPDEAQNAARRKQLEAWIDAGHGSCLLREPRWAALMQNTLLHHDSERYHLFAWVVMPNHVHALFQPLNDWSVPKIVSTWKKYTATQIAKAPGNAGSPGNANLRIGDKRSPIWHREYWDRYIRNEAHFQQAISYIHQNPSKAGLAPRPEDWPYSSAAIQSPMR